MTTGIFRWDLNLHPNEASGLLTIGDEVLLGDHGWDLGFWAVLDEEEIEDRHRPPPRFPYGRGLGDRASARRCAWKQWQDQGRDHTLDVSTGYVYILGSHFGGKAGPLQPKRGFVARIREADVGHVAEDPAMQLDVYRRSFALHRLVNDALKESGPDLIPLGEQTYKALIAATIKRGKKEK